MVSHCLFLTMCSPFLLRKITGFSEISTLWTSLWKLSSELFYLAHRLAEGWCSSGPVCSWAPSAVLDIAGVQWAFVEAVHGGDGRKSLLLQTSSHCGALNTWSLLQQVERLNVMAVYISCYYYCCVRTAVHIPWCQRTTFGSHLSFVLCAPGCPSPQVFKARVYLLSQLARPTSPPSRLSLAFLKLDGGPPAFRPELSYVPIFLWHGTFLSQSSN